MGPVLTQKERIRLLEIEKAELQEQLRKANATLEYVAMMADVDIDKEGEDEHE